MAFLDSIHSIAITAVSVSIILVGLGHHRHRLHRLHGLHSLHRMFMDLLESIWLILRHSDLHKIVTTSLNIGGINLLQGLGIKDKTGVQRVFLCWTGIARNIK
jgi:hypothetical protein